jgi:lipopolysaccharide export system ATP-binding protein
MDQATLLDRSDSPQAAAPVRGLEVCSIAKSYDKRAVLHDVSLSVSRGEVVGLLGPNGAGKTTCFYSVMGLVKPDAGRIILDGQNITSLPMYRRAVLGLGYLPQETSIFRGLTVEQNIMAVIARWPPNPPSCFSTSPSRGSTRSRFRTFATW